MSELPKQRERWVRSLAFVRGLLASACLGLQLILRPPDSLLINLVIALFALSSFLALKWRVAQEGIYALLALFLDAFFFMVLAKFGAAETLWLALAFYVYLLIAAIELFGAKEVVVIAGGCSLFFATVAAGQKQGLRETLMAAGALATLFSFQKRRLLRRVEGLGEEVERLRLSSETAQEAEQQRIAADFHDGPLQGMISVQMRLEILRKIFERDREAGMQELAQLQDVSKAQVRDMRSFVRNMRPMGVDGGGLTAATRRLINEFEKESGIPVTFVGGDRPFTAAPETCTDVLQMIREALNNVARHAEATRVAVTLDRVGKILEVSVDDNGKGFHFSGSYSLDELDLLRVGPASIKRRARSLGAELNLESRPGRGAGLRIRVPI